VVGLIGRVYIDNKVIFLPVPRSSDRWADAQLNGGFVNCHMSPGPTSGDSGDAHVTEPSREFRDPVIALESGQYCERTWRSGDNQSENEGRGDAPPGINFTCVWAVGVFPRHNQ